MIRRPELLIFDCDGVLVDSELIGCRIEAEELAKVGVTITAEEILARFTGVTSKETFAAIEAEWGRPLPPGFERRVQDAIHAAFARELTPIAGVREALARLDLPVCVASSSSPARLEQSLGVTGLWAHFAPNVFSAAAVGRGKPAPDLFRHAAARMGATAAGCVVIEDSLFGVQAGVAAGMRVLGFTGASHCGPGHAGRLLAAGAARVFADMAALPELLVELE